MCKYHARTPKCKFTCASECVCNVSVCYKSATLQGFQTALLKRPGPERRAQLKTLVTDDISRDQTDSVLLPSPKMSGEHKRNIYMAG